MGDHTYHHLQSSLELQLSMSGTLMRESEAWARYCTDPKATWTLAMLTNHAKATKPSVLKAEPFPC